MPANPTQTRFLDLHPVRAIGPAGTAQQHAAAPLFVEQGEMTGLAAAQQRKDPAHGFHSWRRDAPLSQGSVTAA